MAIQHSSAVISQPVSPGPLWQCPQCLAFFSIRFLRIEQRDKWGDVCVYCCGKCDKETEFLTNVPNYVL